MKLVRFSTLMSMPPRFRTSLLGREPYFVETVLITMIAALFRFVYRLLPGSFRYLSPYLDREIRLGYKPKIHEKLFSTTSKYVARAFLAGAMPPRDPDLIKQALEKVTKPPT